MKRYFFVDGLIKEAPSCLMETPRTGSFVCYGDMIWKVAEVAYNLDSKRIYITLTVSGHEVEC